MTTFNTGNPLGSNSPKDLYDNAENLDDAINSVLTTWRDRFGVQRSTWAHMEQLATSYFMNGSMPAYALKAEIPVGGLTPADAGRQFAVTNDPDSANNGTWRWDGTTLVKSADRVSVMETVVSIAARTSVGKNLLNPAVSLVGYYLDQFSSIPVASALYSVSDYISVSPNTLYSATSETGGLRFVTFFNGSRQVVGGGSSSAQNTLRSFTTTAETRFVRVSYLTASVGSLQVEAGPATEFEAFHREAYGPDGAAVHAVPINGSVSTEKVQDESITLPKTAFALQTKNLYNAADPDVMDGYYIQNVSGAAAPNAMYSASGWIPVKSGVTYTRSYSHQGALYDANRAFVSGLANTGASPTQFTPTVDGFVRLTVLLSGKSAFQLEIGSAATDYEPYGYMIDPAAVPWGKSGIVGAQVCDGIVLPSQTYCVAGTSADVEQANLYFSNMLMGYFADKRIDITGTYGRQFGDFWRIEPGSGKAHYGIGTGSFTLTVSVKNYDRRVLLQKSTAVTVFAKAVAAVDAERLLWIGDSLTRNGLFLNHAAGKCGTTLQGGRHFATDPAGLNREGRGGWTLLHYLSYFARADGLDSPFMFPDGVAGATYRGNVVFWRNAVKTGRTEAEEYNFGGFEKLARGWADSGPFIYDTATGYPLSPQVGWVVYDPAQAAGARFREWSGTAWVASAAQPSTWSFDFGKYLARFPELFSAGAPNRVGLLLGANDFQDVDEVDSGTFIGRLQTIITAVRAAIPAVHVIIGLPTVGGPQDGFGLLKGCGQTAYGYTRNMQQLASALLATFDTASMRAGRTWIANFTGVVDPVYGFQTNAEQPNKYSTRSVLRCPDPIHPTPNNPPTAGTDGEGVGQFQMGDCLAGTLMAIRAAG